MNTPVVHAATFVPFAHGSVYVERQTPAEARGDPLVLVHGGVHTGSCYRVTPDGRPGWAQDFVERGFDVLIPDWPGIGRSGYVPPDRLNGAVVIEGLRAVLQSVGRPCTVLVHSMSGPYGIKLLEVAGPLVARLVGVAPGPPGNIQPIPVVLRETEDDVVVQGVTRERTVSKSKPRPMQGAEAREKLIGSSRQFPAGCEEAYLASLVANPPRLSYERQNVGGSQVRLADDVQLPGTPVLVLTGTNDTDHPREVDEGIATWLRQHGAAADYLWLADRGQSGNGHMLMLEENSSAIAGLIAEWIRAHGG